MASIAKADVPTDQSQWEEGTIVEGLGTPEEMEDTFYRSGNWGVKESGDGTYNVYAIVDEEPILIMDGLESFEACTGYINDVGTGAQLGGEDEEGDEPEIVDEPEEVAEEEGEPVIAVEISDEPVPEAPEKEEKSEEKEDSEEKSEGKEEKSEEKDDCKGDCEEDCDEKEEKSEEKDDSDDEDDEKPEKTFKSMMEAREASKSRGHPAGSSPNTINKTNGKGHTAAGIATVYMGCDKDYVGFGQEVKNVKDDNDHTTAVPVKKSAGEKMNADTMSIRDMIAFKKSGGSFGKAFGAPEDETPAPEAPMGAGEPTPAPAMDAGAPTPDPALDAPLGADPGADIPPADDLGADPGVGGGMVAGVDLASMSPEEKRQLKEALDADPDLMGDDLGGDDALLDDSPGEELSSDLGGAGDNVPAPEIAPDAGADIPPAGDVGADVPPMDDVGADVPPADDEDIVKSIPTVDELGFRDLMEFKKSGLDYKSWSIKKWGTSAAGGKQVQTNLDDAGKVADARKDAAKAGDAYAESRNHNEPYGSQKRKEKDWTAKEKAQKDAEYEYSHTKPKE